MSPNLDFMGELADYETKLLCERETSKTGKVAPMAPAQMVQLMRHPHVA